MKNITTPEELFFDQLRDLLSVERQLAKALPELVALAANRDLALEIESMSSDSKSQAASLERIFDNHDIKGGNDVCKAMEGLLEGGRKHLGNVTDLKTRDMMMIAHLYRVQLYQVAGYSMALALAGLTIHPAEYELLFTLLHQERKSALTLSEIAVKAFGLVLENQFAQHEKVN